MYINKSNIYKGNGSFNSKYEELQGKYFKVLDVIRHPEAESKSYLHGKKYFLKLKEKNSGDIVYYQCDTTYETSPFIIVGYFEKLKQKEIGNEYIVNNQKERRDIATGNIISNNNFNTKWKCLDVTINEDDYNISLIMENEKKEKILVRYKEFIGDGYSWDIISIWNAEYYKEKFGEEYWQKVLDGKVAIGMTSEMCIMSWWRPLNINKTTTSGGNSEQWVYKNNYLYFENDILTAIQ